MNQAQLLKMLNRVNKKIEQLEFFCSLNIDLTDEFIDEYNKAYDLYYKLESRLKKSGEKGDFFNT